MTTDFEYIRGDLFTQVIPVTEDAIHEWNVAIAPATAGSGKLMTVEWPSVRAQLEAAGYKVRAVRRVKANDAALLAALEGGAT